MTGVRGRRIVIVVAVIVVAAFLALLFAPGKIVRSAVEKGGSIALGVPVHLKGAGLKLFAGVIELKGLEVENPPGYTTKNAIEVGHINVRVPLTRLICSKPRIESITIEAPVVTLEQAITGSNLSDLLGNTGKSKESSGGRKLVIGRLCIVNARISVSAKLRGVTAAIISLPPLELKELGGEGNQGVTIAQTVALSLWEIVRSAVANGGGVLPAELGSSLSSSVASVDKASRQLVGAVSDTGKQVVGGAGSAAKGLMEGAKGIVK